MVQAIPIDLKDKKNVAMLDEIRIENKDNLVKFIQHGGNQAWWLNALKEEDFTRYAFIYFSYK